MGAHYKNFIAGEWVDGAAVTRDINPSDTNDVVGEYAQADAAQTAAAIEAAHAAFPAWARTTPQERHDILLRASTEILARRDELGRLLSREEGKTLPEGIGEATRAGQIFDFFAGEALRIPGEKFASVRPNVDIEVTREPVGVVGIIAPWNFPIAIPAWKIAPALAYGNTVVFKPADLVPGSAHALAEIIVRAGVPKGVFNLLVGRGSVVGQAILDHKRVDAVTFTGSIATGRRVAAACAVAMRRFQLEMGGKNPLVVLADADLPECGRMRGQWRVFLDRPALHGVVAAHRRGAGLPAFRRQVDGADARPGRGRRPEAGNAYRPGRGCDPARAKPLLCRDRPGRRGEARARGERLNRATPGFYMAPALFLDADNSMRISREEIFGPVSAMIPARDYDHALAIANDTEFGLCAGICTTSLKHASHFKRNAEVGMAMVNLPTAGVDYHAPFGGRKGSNLGPREQGRYAVEFYTTVKTAYTLG